MDIDEFNNFCLIDEEGFDNIDLIKDEEMKDIYKEEKFRKLNEMEQKNTEDQHDINELIEQMEIQIYKPPYDLEQEFNEEEIIETKEEQYIKKYFGQNNINLINVYINVDIIKHIYDISCYYSLKLKEMYNIPEIPKIYFWKMIPNILSTMSILSKYISYYFNMTFDISTFKYSSYEFVNRSVNLYKILRMLYTFYELNIKLDNCEIIVGRKKQNDIFIILDKLGNDIKPYINVCDDYMKWNNILLTEKIETLKSSMFSFLLKKNK